MKRHFTYLLSLTMLFAVSCEGYDDSELTNRMDSLEDRVVQLAEQCQQMNDNISLLQSLVEVLQSNDYVTGVTPITKNGETIGYSITFAKAQPITIYHGEDGEDGQNGINGTNGQNGLDGLTPIIGVKKHTDGIYYWTLNGDWLLDDNGNKIKAQGVDGKNGENGENGEPGENGAPGDKGDPGNKGDKGDKGDDGITPRLKIEDEYWYISYDNGVSWTKLGKATGDDGQNGDAGNSFFQSIDTTNSDYVVFTLADGTELWLPRHKGVSISFDVTGVVACMPSASVRVGYTLTGADAGTTVETVGDGGWKSVVTKIDDSSGYIIITSPATGGDGKVLVFATTSNGFTAMKAICFEEGTIADINDAYQVGYEASTLKVALRTNITYVVNIPEEAQSWISVAETRAAMRSETLTFMLKENYDAETRSATIELESENGETLQDFVIIQDAQPVEGIIRFADANAKRVCVNQYDTDGDGELSKEEAAEVTVVAGKFFGDDSTIIKSFDEFAYFINLKTIGMGLFWDCTSLESIVIPESVTKIGGLAFSNCSSLKSINIPSGVTVISGSTFWECSGLESVVIPASVTKIENHAFAGCSNLKSVALPDGVTEIGISAFAECSSLKSVTIPSGITNIQDRVFSDCSSLESVVIPNGVTALGIYAFANCSSLKSIVIPDGVTKIENRAFSGCSSLESIVIPEDVTEMGSYVIDDCDNLLNIYCKSATPPALTNYLFYLDDYSSKKIYVPIGSGNAYKTAEFWTRYADQIQEYDFE